MAREIYYTVSNELKERGNGFYCNSFLNVN